MKIEPLKKLLPLLAFCLALLLSNALNAQDSVKKIDELENTILKMQAELERMKSQTGALPFPQTPTLAKPALDGVVPADQQPSLDFAPSYQPGAPGIVIDESTPTVIVEGPPATIFEVPRTAPMVRLVPVFPYPKPYPYSDLYEYRYSTYRPNGGYGCGTDADCPYRDRGAYRPPYSSYDDSRSSGIYLRF